MRSSILSDSEIAAFTKFTTDYDILIDHEVGVKNADILCGPIINSDSEITLQTLAASLLNVKNQIQFKSAMYKKAEALTSKLHPDEVAAYQSWAKNQKLILDNSEEGYTNLATLLGWLRGNSVTAHSLDLSLGNCINNGDYGRLHFRPQPKADRSYGPGGKLNHSIVNKSEEGFMPHNQTNRSLRQVMEDNRPKVDTVPTPVSINVEYKAKAESVQGRSHGQTDQARRLFVMVPNTSEIDWRETYAAREKFLNTQLPLVRR